MPRLTTFGVVCGLAAAGVLVARAPREPPPTPARFAVPSTALRALPPPPSDAALQLFLTDPPHIPARILGREDPLEIAVGLPRELPVRGLTIGNEALVDHPGGGLLVLPPDRLSWGLNVLHLEGADAFGRPVDRAWPLLVGDTLADDAWITPGVQVQLLREGFIDADRLDDDLSSIAARQVAAALSLIPSIDVGPVTASHFRAAETRVAIVPGPGQLAVSVDFRRVYMDVDIEVVALRNLVVNHLWVDAILRVDLDADGNPAVFLEDISPHMDLVERTEGAWNWIVDHAAWVLEVAGEALSAGPLREAVTAALDEALQRWVSSVAFETVPPLARRRLEVSYRFSRLRVDDGGLTADLAVRVTCEGATPVSLGTLVWSEPGHAEQLSPPGPDEAEGVPLRVSLSTNAANAVLHAAWRCRALDTTVAFAEAHAELPLLVPASVTTRFTLPPLVQPVGGDLLGLGVGGVEARIDYGDAAYEVVASGHLPVVLESTDDGRALRVGFDPSVRNLALYTDCLALDGQACRDNALFDRLAWLALPFLPPIGATLPLPDVRLPASSLRLRLGPVRFDARRGALDLAVGYELQ